MNQPSKKPESHTKPAAATPKKPATPAAPAKGPTVTPRVEPGKNPKGPASR